MALCSTQRPREDPHVRELAPGGDGAEGQIRHQFLAASDAPRRAGAQPTTIVAPGNSCWNSAGAARWEMRRTAAQPAAAAAMRSCWASFSASHATKMSSSGAGLVPARDAEAAETRRRRRAVACQAAWPDTICSMGSQRRSSKPGRLRATEARTFPSSQMRLDGSPDGVGNDVTQQAQGVAECHVAGAI